MKLRTLAALIFAAAIGSGAALADTAAKGLAPGSVALCKPTTCVVEKTCYAWDPIGGVWNRLRDCKDEPKDALPLLRESNPGDLVATSDFQFWKLDNQRAVEYDVHAGQLGTKLPIVFDAKANVWNRSRVCVDWADARYDDAKQSWVLCPNHPAVEVEYRK